MSTHTVLDQFAVNSVSVRSEFADQVDPVLDTALSHANLPKLAMRKISAAGVYIEELPVTGLLVLRAREDSEALSAALTKVVGLKLPGVLQANATNSDEASAPIVRWIAPDEWLLSCALSDAFELEQAIRDACEGKSIAVVNVSGGFTVLRLSGPDANMVLKKSTAYDVHPKNFGSGKVVNTVLGKSQVTMHCLSSTHYEIIIRRSFADYVWHWLQVAAREYGLGIKQS